MKMSDDDSGSGEGVVDDTVLDTRTREKNGMRFTFRHYADGRITCEVRRTDDDVLIVREHDTTLMRDEVCARYGW
jgi:hypothetical protein